MSMTTNKPHPFALEPWLTVPFENRLKTPIDKLVDILLSLPGGLALGDEISNHGSGSLSCIETRLYKYAQDVISQLDCWHQRYCAEVVEPNGQIRTFLSQSIKERLGVSDLRFVCPQGRAYRDGHTAVFIAMYDAANLLAFSLLSLVSPPTDQCNHRMQFHAQSILSANYFMESNGSTAPAGGYVLMAFPLKIAGLWGPLQEQRDHAIRKLQNWDREGGSRNICRFAAPVFLESSTTVALSSVYHANVAAKVRLKQNSLHVL